MRTAHYTQEAARPHHWAATGGVIPANIGNSSQLGKAAEGEISKIAYTVEQAIVATGLGRTTIYSLLKDGSLRKIKMGSRTLIFRSDLVSLLEGAATPKGSH